MTAEKLAATENYPPATIHAFVLIPCDENHLASRDATTAWWKGRRQHKARHPATFEAESSVCHGPGGPTDIVSPASGPRDRNSCCSTSLTPGRSDPLRLILGVF